MFGVLGQKLENIVRDLGSKHGIFGYREHGAGNGGKTTMERKR